MVEIETMKALTQDEVTRYAADGYLPARRVLTADEAARYRAALEACETGAAARLGRQARVKSHLLFPWADSLVRDPNILDIVEDLIGPDILCWSTTHFIKEPNTPHYVSWHQDLTYWGLDPADVVTAWVALSPASVESGCMRVIPGSHKKEIVPHTDTFAEHNLLSRGQEIAIEVDEAAGVDLILSPGEISLHHVKLAHGSGPNRTDDRRIGFAIRYMPPHVRQTAGREGAILLRGVDRHGHFDLERAPAADMDAAAIAQHHSSTAAKDKIIFRGTTATR